MKAPLLLALVAALVPAAAALAASKTTKPSQKVSIAVILYDDKIQVQTFHQLGSGPTASLNAMAGPIPRGDFISINVYNAGKKVHDFAVFGRKTKPLKPKAKAHIFLSAVARGNFRYESTLDKGKAFRGFFTVA